MENLQNQLNVDRRVRVIVHTKNMGWAPSPSPSVWRKRLALEGPQESGRVTSVVRYDANSEFKEHGHPDGEEIMVLEGSWQDANGDHPAGTYMLNPEGFRHAPRSKDGCVLLVKLRQHGGPSREHMRLDTETMPWQDSGMNGVQVKSLYTHQEHAETMRIESWAAGSKVERNCPVLTEYLFIEGGAQEATENPLEVFCWSGADEMKRLGSDTFEKWSWLRVPAGGQISMTSTGGCRVFVKEGEWRSS